MCTVAKHMCEQAWFQVQWVSSLVIHTAIMNTELSNRVRSIAMQINFKYIGIGFSANNVAPYSCFFLFLNYQIFIYVIHIFAKSDYFLETTFSSLLLGLKKNCITSNDR